MSHKTVALFFAQILLSLITVCCFAKNSGREKQEPVKQKIISSISFAAMLAKPLLLKT
jgi:hypothetical protein